MAEVAPPPRKCRIPSCQTCLSADHRSQTCPAHLLEDKISKKRRRDAQKAKENIPPAPITSPIQSVAGSTMDGQPAGIVFNVEVPSVYFDNSTENGDASFKRPKVRLSGSHLPFC